MGDYMSVRTQFGSSQFEALTLHPCRPKKSLPSCPPPPVAPLGKRTTESHVLDTTLDVLNRHLRGGPVAGTGENPLLLMLVLMNMADPVYAQIVTAEDARGAVDASYVRFRKAGKDCSADHLAKADDDEKVDTKPANGHTRGQEERGGVGREAANEERGSSCQIRRTQCACAR